MFEIIYLLILSISAYLLYRGSYLIILSYKTRQLFPVVYGKYWMIDYIFGVVLEMASNKDYTETMYKWHITYGDTVCYNFFMFPNILTRDPELVKLVTIQHNKQTRRPAFISDMIKPLLGNGLLLMETEMHQKYKKLFLPCFSQNNMANLFPFIVNRAHALVNKLNASELNIMPLFGSYTLDIVCKLCFNYNLNSIESDSNLSTLISDAFNTIDNNETLPSLIPFYYQLPFAANLKRKEIHKLLNIVIKNFIKEKKGYNEDILQVLLKNKNSFDEMRDHILTFIMAGNETTSTTLGWFTYYMAVYPKEQDHLYSALKSINCEDAKELEECKQLNFVINEVLRLKPAVASTARELTQSIVYKDKVIPKGINIMINIAAMNMNVDNPTSFDPSRWEKGMGQYEYIPFYIGFRSCIGKQLALTELRVMIATLMTKYKIIKTKETLNTQPGFHITQRPEPGVHVELQLR